MTASSQASALLNFQVQVMVSVQKPFCFSSRVPWTRSPVPRHEPISSLKGCKASRDDFGGASAATPQRQRNSSVARMKVPPKKMQRLATEDTEGHRERQRDRIPSCIPLWPSVSS